MRLHCKLVLFLRKRKTWLSCYTSVTSNSSWKETVLPSMEAHIQQEYKVIVVVVLFSSGLQQRRSLLDWYTWRPLIETPDKFNMALMNFIAISGSSKRSVVLLTYRQPQMFADLIFYFLPKQLYLEILGVWQQLNRDSMIYKDLYGISALHQLSPILHYLHKK